MEFPATVPNIRQTSILVAKDVVMRRLRSTVEQRQNVAATEHTIFRHLGTCDVTERCASFAGLPQSFALAVRPGGVAEYSFQNASTLSALSRWEVTK